MNKFLLKDYGKIFVKRLWTNIIKISGLILLKVYEQKLLELMGKSF